MDIINPHKFQYKKYIKTSFYAINLLESIVNAAIFYVNKINVKINLSGRSSCDLLVRSIFTDIDSVLTLIKKHVPF